MFDRVHPSDSISQIGSKVREGRVYPSQTISVTGRSRVSSCTPSSKASSVLSERVKLAAEKAAMVAEVFLSFVFRRKGITRIIKTSLGTPRKAS